jgi:hypothetical protein
MRAHFDRLTDDLAGMKEFSHALDRRVVRIETMIEMASRGLHPPYIEGN